LGASSNVYVEQASMRPLWESYQRQQTAHLRVYRSEAQDSVDSETEENDVDMDTDTESDLRRMYMVETDYVVQPANFGYWRPRVLDFTRPGPEGYLASSSSTNNFGYHIVTAEIPGSGGSVGGALKQRPIETRPLAHIVENELGCRPFTKVQSKRIQGNILVLKRGGCLFILKAFYAQAAGAHSMVVINTDESLFAMTGVASNTEERSSLGSQIGDRIPEEDIDITSVMMGHSAGQELLDLLREEEALRPWRVDSKPHLVGGFVQSKLSRSQLEGARLSYNNLPIVNIRTLKSRHASND
ncbi:hypothetical protein BGZ94_006049, partial [Podila epigama]